MYVQNIFGGPDTSNQIMQIFEVQTVMKKLCIVFDIFKSVGVTIYIINHLDLHKNM